jgi:S-adenosylmethionine decarboxylase
MVEAARRANATIVTDVFHNFNPHGISGVVVIAESHVAIHSWPEHLCASVDIFSCSDKMTPEVIEDFLKDAFKAEHVVRMEIERGRVPFSLETNPFSSQERERAAPTQCP